MDKTGNPFGASFKSQFERPICLFNSLRNLFLHEGSIGIFAGADAADGFQVLNEGWERVAKGADTTVDGHKDPRFPQFVAPIADLRTVFQSCEAEMDEALGILLAAACGLLRVHACCMLGEQ